MKKLLLLAALAAGGTLGLQQISAAHGGTYRGPGDTVPPGGGGGGGGGGPGSPGGAPSSPGPAGPSSPAPVSPGGANAPSAQPGTPTTGAGASGADLTLWQFWWGFNKEPYLNLKSKIRGSGVATGSDEFFLGAGSKQNAKDTKRPGEEKIQGSVVPALLKAIENERNNDIITGCLIALAKIGDKSSEGGESRFENVIKGFLGDPTQEIAETAATALGILGNESSIPTLVALMFDRTSPDGSVDPHKLVKSTSVPMRTRAFATYGLGLIGANATSNEVRQQIAEHLMDMLVEPELSTRDVKVGAMIALGLTPIDIAAADAVLETTEGDESNHKHVLSRQAQIEFILDYFDPSKMRANEKNRHWFTVSHAPTAMARLLRDVPEESGLKKKVAAALISAIGTHSKLQNEIQQSCVLALGQIGDCDSGKSADDGVDVEIRKELVRMVKEGDEQSRRYALISMAQVGSRRGTGEEPWGGMREIRNELMAQMAKGRSQIKPWAALSLGVLGYALSERGEAQEESVNRALLSSCDEEKTPEQVGAYCLALGLRKYPDARELILDVLIERFGGSDDARGEAAVALGLLGDRASIQPIQEVISESKYKPELLKQAAIGLGLLGDSEIVPELVAMLAESKGLATQAAISSALGVIGDARSIDPLVALLENGQLTDRARGFAAVALGIVCDKEDLPWNSRIAVNTNYRANTVTLTGEEGTGILDIL
jgi:HEAT repeat protein